MYKQPPEKDAVLSQMYDSIEVQVVVILVRVGTVLIVMIGIVLLGKINCILLKHRFLSFLSSNMTTFINPQSLFTQFYAE